VTKEHTVSIVVHGEQEDDELYMDTVKDHAEIKYFAVDASQTSPDQLEEF
jgi:hypothetical protein